MRRHERCALRVGPGHPFSVPSEAARIAQDGDVVEIATGRYDSDVVIWPQHDLTAGAAAAGLPAR